MKHKWCYDCEASKRHHWWCCPNKPRSDSQSKWQQDQQHEDVVDNGWSVVNAEKAPKRVQAGSSSGGSHKADLRSAEEVAKLSEDKKRRKTEPATVSRWKTGKDGGRIPNPEYINSDVDGDSADEEADEETMETESSHESPVDEQDITLQQA